MLALAIATLGGLVTTSRSGAGSAAAAETPVTVTATVTVTAGSPTGSPSGSPTSGGSASPSGSSSPSGSTTPTSTSSTSTSPSTSPTTKPTTRPTAKPTSKPKPTAEIYGHAYGPGNSRVQVQVALFTGDWKYIRAVKSSRGGVYRMSGVEPGTYHLQFSDARPRWDTRSLATTDVVLRIPKGVPAVRADAYLRRGASITGRVTAGGRPARRPLVRAVSTYGATYDTQADTQGRFALGGLPAGSYSVFSYDRQRRYAGKGEWVGKLKRGRNADIRLRMTKRAGAYSGFLLVNGAPARGTIYVTAVSRRTGQFWIARVSNGDLSSLRGLYPGPYRLEIPASSQTVAQTVSLPSVQAGRTRVVYVYGRHP